MHLECRCICVEWKGNFRVMKACTFANNHTRCQPPTVLCCAFTSWRFWVLRVPFLALTAATAAIHYNSSLHVSPSPGLLL